MKNAIRTMLLALLTSCVALPAAADVINYRYANPVKYPSPVQIEISVLKDVESFSASLDCRDGKKVGIANKKYKAGDNFQLPLKLPVGSHECDLRYSEQREYGGSGAGVHLRIDVVPDFKVNMSFKKGADGKSEFTIKSDKNLAKAEIEYRDDTGKSRTESVVFAKNAKIQHLPVDVEIGHDLDFSITVFDASGLWYRQDFAYFVIPHQEIQFATNSSVIPAEQAHTLKESMDYIKNIMNRGGNLQLSLYIAGYTDTVGKADKNLKLSKARAESIAKWFKQAGFSQTIFYQGHGESHLAVKTPDETDQAANRRAVYVLSNTQPVGEQFNGTPWKALP